MLTGFHGKLPGAGDFVSRGLPSGFLRFWDIWVTRHLARRQGDWPAGGLRLRLVSGGRVAAGVVVPSLDRVRRQFPLSAFVIAPELPSPQGLDPWCDAVRDVLSGAIDDRTLPDDLLDALERVEPPEGEGGADQMLLWRQGYGAKACDPSDPGAVLDDLFSCSGSSRP